MMGTNSGPNLADKDKEALDGSLHGFGGKGKTPSVEASGNTSDFDRDEFDFEGNFEGEREYDFKTYFESDEEYGFSDEDFEFSYDDDDGFDDEEAVLKEPLTAGKVVLRCIIAFFTALLLVLFAVYATLLTVARGPSETVRNMLVLSASQASATKWMPKFFLDGETVDEILENSEKVTVDVITAEDWAAQNTPDNTKDGEEEAVDEWENAVDGTLFNIEKGSTYKAYVLLVKDASRVFVGTASDDFSTSSVGMDIFEITEKYGALAGINGGEFPDAGGVGSGHRPMGLTYSEGECVWNDSLHRTFIGFDSNDRLVVSEGMTYAEAESLGIRDAVSFQNGNVLIDSTDGNVNLHRANSNTGTAQRTAIGQREDGTVIMIVTDGRTASSLGATHNDMVDLMVKYRAVNAAMLDGGSSAMLYFENYYDIFPEFEDATLDKYQQRGLINKYQAFSDPRTIPTFFLVKKGAEQ